VRRVLPLLAMLLLGFAPAPFPRQTKTKADWQALQGEWIRVSLTICGKKRFEAPGAIILTIRGDQIAFAGTDPGDKRDEWKFKLDISKGQKRIDFRSVIPADQIPNTNVMLGIYRIEENILTICSHVGKETTDRPLNFDPAQKKVWLHVYKRKIP